MRRVLFLGSAVVVTALGLGGPATALGVPPVVGPIATPPVSLAPIDRIAPELPRPASPTPSLPASDVPALSDATASAALAEVPAPPAAAPVPTGLLPRRGARSAAQPGSPTPPPASNGGERPAAHPSRSRHAAPSRIVAPVFPAIHDEVVDARPARVTGRIDRRSPGGLSSTLGTAATSFALWGALCLLALVARRVAISAWYDATRRRRALSPR